ncbi:RWD domain-containing protein 1 [Culicoides brevitarsis]|uniref:RWD domain-containing protein 1 n=1 Tax=Culicoides brevitarsis TaxID=469753 RepID=UPI00307BAF1C
MERNYKEDQCNEIEALDSIYCGEMEILETEPFHKFGIPIATEEFNTEDQTEGLACKLIFTYTSRYPDEGPLVDVEDPINFEDEILDERLVEHINEVIQENLGMEMIFTLVSSAQEYLNLRWDDLKKEKEREIQRKLEEIEEMERKKFEGTRVTVESFLKWRKEFEIDMGIIEKRDKAQISGKLTGKELFLRDNTLNESDIKFLIEAGENIDNVKIDETLFQNIEDLELESDDEDDEDYAPGN